MVLTLCISTEALLALCGTLTLVHVTVVEANPNEQQLLKIRCKDFLLEAAKQVKMRLPNNIELWKSMSAFSPSMILSQVKPPLSSLFLLKLFKGDVGRLDTQYNAINFTAWQNKEDRNALEFWIEVFKHTDASSENCLKELAEFALALMAKPLSNVDVERIFSQINIVKSKLRNRLGQKALTSVLHVRYGLRRLGMCCKDFQPTKGMLQRLMY
ncbi:UNVERIFIED_CONTAM: hypothetical protein FKN15_071681 [Acipenser sinensis]